MKLLRILLRTAWIVIGLAAIVAWGFMAVGTGLTFLFAYGSPPDTYTGQMDDRHAAWGLLIVLAALSVIVVIVAVWPLARWRRRRSAAGHRARSGHAGTAMHSDGGGQICDHASDQAFCRGAGDENRTRTISLGIRPIGASDRPELGSRCTASDRHGPCDTRLNGPPMARGQR